MQIRIQTLLLIALTALSISLPCIAADLYNTASTAAASLKLNLKFAPRMSGDGQTPSWRIIEIDEAHAKPWSAIGNILVPGRVGYCSAFLVAPRIVLTANHCLYRADSRKTRLGRPAQQSLDPRQLVFVAGLHDEISLDVVGVQEVITGDWTPNSKLPDKDWMIVILSRPVATTITPLAFVADSPQAVLASWGNRLVIAAYPGETLSFSEVLRFSFNCSVLKSQLAGVLVHNCHTEGGSSGGPIFVEQGGKRQLIGIHAGRHDGRSHYKYGVWISSFARQLQSAIARVALDEGTTASVDAPNSGEASQM